MKISVNRKDAIWGYVSTAFSMCINFIMLPFILHYLTGDEVGIYYIFASISAIGSFFDFGFTPCFARSVSYAWSGADTIDPEGGSLSVSNEPNYNLLKKIIRTCQILYFLLASTALILSLSVGTVYVHHLIKDLEGYHSYLIAWFVYAGSIFLSLLYGYYSALLSGVGAVRFSNKAMVIGRVIQIALCIGLLIAGAGLIGVAVAYLSYGFAFRFIAKHYFDTYHGMRQKLKESKVNVTKADIKNMISKIWPNTWKEGVVTLSNYIANQGTVIICSMFFSLYETGLYSLTNQLVQAVVSISSAMYNTFMPALQSAYANQDKEGQRKNFSAVIVTYVVLFLCGMLALFVLGNPVVKLMKPEYSLSLPLLAGIGIYQFVLKYRNCFATYFSSTNRVIYYKSYLISAIAAIILSWCVLTIANIGIWGMVIPHIVAQLSYNAWYWSLKAHKELELTPVSVFKIGLKESKRLIKGRS